MKTILLKDLLIALENGNRPKGGVSQITEGIPSIGGEHLNSKGGFDFDNLKYVPKNFYDSMRRGKIEKEDILIVKDGATTGKTSFVHDNFPYYISVVNEHVFIVRADTKKVIPKYLFYVLFSKIGQSQIMKTFHGSAIGGINSKFVDSVRVPIPSLPIQKRIVSILERAEKLKEKREKANEETNKIIQNIFYKMFGDPITNSEKLPTQKIEKLCTLVRGSSPRPKGDQRYYGGKIPRLMIQDITRDGRIVIPKIDFLTEEGAKLSRPVKKGTVIMTVSGGVGVIAELGVDACIHDGFVAFKELDETQVNKTFFEFFMIAIKILHEKNKAGAIFQNLTTSQVKNMDIILPEIKLQNRFAELVKKIEILKDKQKQSTEEINTLFDALMQKAFKGELIV